MGGVILKGKISKKTFVSVLMILCSMIFNTFALAYPGEMNSAMRRLNYMQGSWYDLSGREAYLFSNGTVNGYQINNLYDVAGGGGDFGCKLGVIVNGNQEAWQLSFTNLSAGPSDYHQYMTIAQNVYRRSSSPRYYESIGGIFLGMPLNQLLSLYGKPSLARNNGHGLLNLGYANLGLEIDVRHNIVTQITIYPFGDRAFDRSGLNANNTASEYADAYGMNRQPGNYATGIGYKEYIWFRESPKSVTLSLYWN